MAINFETVGKRIKEVRKQKGMSQDELAERADGDMGIADFCQLLKIQEDDFETESDTVGGWVLEHYEEYPGNGESFEDQELGLKVTIVSIIDRRIDKLLVDVIK